MNCLYSWRAEILPRRYLEVWTEHFFCLRGTQWVGGLLPPWSGFAGGTNFQSSAPTEVSLADFLSLFFASSSVPFFLSLPDFIPIVLASNRLCQENLAPNCFDSPVVLRLLTAIVFVTLFTGHWFFVTYLETRACGISFGILWSLDLQHQPSPSFTLDSAIKML